MVDASNVVTSTFSIRDSVPSTQNFGAMLCVCAAPAGYVGTHTYPTTPAGLTAILADGFSEDSFAYKCLAAVNAQQPHTATFKVFPRATKNSQSYTITPTVLTQGYVYRGTIECLGVKTEFAVTNGASETAATIVTKILAAINSATGFTKTNNTTSFTLAPASNDRRIYLRSLCAGLVVDDPSVDGSIATSLTAAYVADADFWGFVIDSTSGAENEAAAAWALSNAKFFAGLTLDSDVYASGTSDVLSTVKATANYRALIIPTRDGLGLAQCALMGRQLSRDPGTSNWAFKTLAGAIADAWTETELGHIHSKNGVPYAIVEGLNWTLYGCAASGRFVDITHGTDWLNAEIKTDVLLVFANNEIITYDDDGIAMLESALRAALQSARSRKLIQPGFIVKPPIAAEVSQQNKINRALRDMTWGATWSGGINSVYIDGSISL